jgi:quercetin dioxygenase-like cupin family protein
MNVRAPVRLVGFALSVALLGGCGGSEGTGGSAAADSAAPAAAAAPAPAASQVPTATQRFPQFENDSVAVWKTVIAPNQPLSMHRHEHGRVIVALKGGTLKIVPENGEPYTVTWETGNAYWLSPDPPGTMHGDVNEGADAIEVMVIEMRP